MKGINLTVNKGEVVTIIGGSGSGKSTLLTCINGLEPINAGQITIDGTDVHGKQTDLNKLRRKVGIVFQQWNAFPHLTVLENVMLAPRKVLGLCQGKSRGNRRQAADPCRLGRKAVGLSQPHVGRAAAAHGNRPGAGHVAGIYAV